jgi:nitroreductase
MQAIIILILGSVWELVMNFIREEGSIMTLNNETLETLKKLRTIHWNFNEKEVTDEEISIIIKHSMRAANATNLSNYSIIVVDDVDVIKKITGKPCKSKCLVFCLDYNRIAATASHLGYDYVPGKGWYGFIGNIFDVSILTQTAVIAAKSLGIDSLITNAIFRQDIRDIKKILKLPEKYCFPVMTVLLGHSDKPDSQTTGRLSAKHVVHKGTYTPISDIPHEEIIAEFDTIYPECINEQYPRYLDWYHKVWEKPSEDTKRGIPSKLDEQLYEVLRESGFNL